MNGKSFKRKGVLWEIKFDNFGEVKEKLRRLGLLKVIYKSKFKQGNRIYDSLDIFISRDGLYLYLNFSKSLYRVEKSQLEEFLSIASSYIVPHEIGCMSDFNCINLGFEDTSRFCLLKTDIKMIKKSKSGISRNFLSELYSELFPSDRLIVRK